MKIRVLSDAPAAPPARCVKQIPANPHLIISVRLIYRIGTSAGHTFIFYHNNHENPRSISCARCSACTLRETDTGNPHPKIPEISKSAIAKWIEREPNV